MRIDLRQLLQFFDDPQETGHASAIIGLIGEDLCAAAFVHYWINCKKRKAKILNNKINNGRQKGKKEHWLDKWISINKVLYQCEIKNWAATALGGKRLKVSVTPNMIIQTSNENWHHQSKVNLSGPNHPNKVTKVLLPMRLPDGYSSKTRIEPLLIYWMPISNTKSTEPFFTINTSSLGNKALRANFKRLHIFSVSLYLRTLLKHRKSLSLKLPNIEKRLQILNTILQL